MEELAKKPEFLLSSDLDTKYKDWNLGDLSNASNIVNLPQPKMKDMSEIARSYRINKDLIEKIKNSDTPPETNFFQDIGAGLEDIWTTVKTTPDEILNNITRHYANYYFPDATAKEALEVAKANSNVIRAIKEETARKHEREGTAGITEELTATIGNAGLLALISYFSPAAGAGLMTAVEGSSIQEDWAQRAYEKGEDLKNTDLLASDAVGAVNGVIEQTLGLGRLAQKIATKTLAGRAVKNIGLTALGEGAEEGLQETTGYLTGLLTDNEGRTFDEFATDALTATLFGAVAGGALGSGGYYIGRKSLIGKLNNYGFTQEESASIADELIDTGKSELMKEIMYRNQLTESQGEAYDILAQNVKDGLLKAGWETKYPDKDLDTFAKLNAKTMVAPAISLSNISHMPIMDFLDLMKIRTDGNVFYIDMPNVDDPKAIAEQVKKNKEEIKALKQEIAIDNKGAIAKLQNQNKILNKRLESLGYVEEKSRKVMNRQKAAQDQAVLAETKPEVIANLSEIRNAQGNEKFVYVGNKRVPVEYKIKSLDEVQASHVAGEPNPKYTFKELQNRTRGTVVDDAILQNRAANLKPEELAESPNTQYGAPVINKNGEIISGNGRYETLRRAYELGNTSYKKMLKKLGYNVEGIERPILVRETTDDLTPEQQIAIAEASNVSETSAFDHARQATNDAKLLKKGISDPVSFAAALPVNERQAYIRENGRYDLLALQRRFDDAVLAWIIEDTKTFDALVLSNRISPKVMKGLSMQGGNIVDFDKNFPSVGLKKDLRYALIKSASLRTRGQFIASIQQQDIEQGTTFSADALLYFMTFSNNTSDLSNSLNTYMTKHQEYLEGEKDNMFGDSLPKQSKEDLTGQVLRAVELEKDAFTSDGRPNNANIKAIFANQIPVEDVAYGTVNPENKLLQEELGTYSESEDNIYWQWKEAIDGLKYSKSNRDLKIMLDDFPSDADYRLLYDKNNGYWFYADANDKIHNDMFIDAFKAGMYPEFKSVSEAQRYLDEKLYEDDGTITRLLAKGYSNNNYMQKIEEMGDDYALAYIVENEKGKGVVIFARYESDLVDAGLTSYAKKAKVYEITNKRYIELPYAQRKLANGFFDAELKTIVIGSNFNFGTLQHEVAHYYLDKIFNIYKSGYGTQEFKDFTENLFSILNVDPNQTKLSRDQHEQFATMAEAYLFNKGMFPAGAEPSMKLFFDWCPSQYNELVSLGYHNESGEFIPAMFDEKSLAFFDAMYAEVPNMAEPNFNKKFINPVMANGDQPKATQELQEERKKLIDAEAVTETVPPLTTQPEAVQKAYFENQNKEDPLIEEAYAEARETEQERPKTATEKFIQYVLPGRGTNTREQMDKVAQEYIAKNRANAERVAFGSPIPQSTATVAGVEITSDYVENNTGIDRAVLILNMMKEYKENSPEYQQLYHNFALHRSYASKSAGLTNDVSTNFYMKGYTAIEKALTERAAVVRYGTKKDAINRYNADVDRFIKENMKDVVKTEPETAERDKVLREVVEKMNAMFGSEDSRLFQEDLTARKIRKGDKAAFTDWARRKIRRIQSGKEVAEAGYTTELMKVSIEAQKSLPDINSNDKDKAVNASRNIRKWQDFVNDRTKGLSDSFLNKVIGEYMPRAMLSAPSTHILNNVSNAVNYIMTKTAMRFHFGENKVNNLNLQQEQDRLWAIYNATGQNLTESMTADQVSRLHGEKYMIPEAKGFWQAIDPFRWLGKEDFYFRSHMYLDTLGRIATQDAKGDPKKATELFEEYKKVGTTGRSAEARMQAIVAGNVAVFTDDGTLAKIVANVRSEVNRINLIQFGEKGHQGLGTIIAPFAKVPTNIIGMGIEALSSPFKGLSYGIYKTTGLKGFKNKWTLKDSVAAVNFGGLTACVLAIIAAGVDYEPPYQKGRGYNSNRPYDSIKIGSVWINLDSFGALSVPLRFTLTMIKGYNAGKDINQLAGAGFDTLVQDIPFLDLNMDYAFKKPVDWLENATYNQVNKLIPAILRQPIKLGLQQTGYTIPSNNRIAKKFARQYGLDGQETSINDFIRFIYRGVTIEE